MLLTQLEYFIALAREEHFGRAASAVYVSPSTLSESIRKLENELHVPLVRRGRTYQGLTREGELVLQWARRVVADHLALTDSLAAARNELTAKAQLGVIPAGMAESARIISTLRAQHPQVTAQVTTAMTSEQIVEKVRSFDLDGGIIHPSAAEGTDLRLTTLNSVRAVVVCSPEVRDTFFPDGVATAEILKDVPLCMLEPKMRARQIFDQRMDTYGYTLHPSIETDSVEQLLALTRIGSWAAIVPDSAVLHRSETALDVVPLKEPEIIMPLALVRLAEHPTPPLSLALESASRKNR